MAFTIYLDPEGTAFRNYVKHAFFALVTVTCCGRDKFATFNVAELTMMGKPVSLTAFATAESFVSVGPSSQMHQLALHPHSHTIMSYVRSGLETQT